MKLKSVIVVLLVLCCTVFVQARPKVAVFMSSSEPKGAKIKYLTISTKLAESISQSRDYIAVDHTFDIIKELQKSKRPVAFDENQMKFIGRVLKAQYFCVIEVTMQNKGKIYDINVRLADAATGAFINSVSASTTRDAANVNESVARLGRKIIREIELAEETPNQPASSSIAGIKPFSEKPLSIGYSEEKPRLAVYVVGEMEDNEKRVAQTIILDGFVKSGSYRAIERADLFIEELVKEQQKQRSGAVDEGQIVALGRQAGAQHICIVDVAEAFGSKQISARIVDVLTAEVLGSGVSAVSINSMNDLTRASDEVIQKVLGKRR